MLRDNYNETVQVNRLETVIENYEETSKKAFAVHIAALSCFIQALEDAINRDINVGFGKDWILFCDEVDIIAGDHIIWNDEEYRIVALERFGESRNPHLEIKIRAFKS